ncbi:hypothetical protein UK82_06535 [Frankia sp. ACN1ag]|nr:hypothetical protein UK82_06535 [Frankia sp. ACN1ag]
MDTPEAWSIAGSWQRGATATPDAAAITAVPAPGGPPAGDRVVVPGEPGGGAAAAYAGALGRQPGGPAGGPAGADPDPGPDDPLKAAMQYRRLLGASDAARARADRDAYQRRQGGRAQARRHREAAADIRARVESVWAQVAEPLAQYGLTELDQLRPAAAEPAAAVALTKKSAPRRGADAPAQRRPGRPLASSGRDLRGGSDAGHAAGRQGGSGRAGRSGRGELGVVGQPTAAAPVDPRTAPRQAYDLCLEAMSKAAELRAVSKAAGSASAGLMTALACLLSLVVVGVLRAFTEAPGLPCIIGAAVLAAALVAVAAGSDGGVMAVFRAGMLGAGAAAVAVLATFRLAPMAPVDVAAALLALAAAARFGLGLGSGTEQAPPSGSRAGGSRKG